VHQAVLKNSNKLKLL